MPNARDRWTLRSVTLLGITLIGLVSGMGHARMARLGEKARAGQEDLDTRQAEISKCVSLAQALPEREREVAGPVTIHVRGDLRTLRRFLDALRGLPRIYNVTSLHISQAKGPWAAHGDTVEAWLTIERFTAREERPAE